MCDAVQSRKRSTKQINLSFDEWNVWYHSNDADTKITPWQVGPHLLEDVYNFEDALLVGSLLMTLLKHADRVKIACLAQLVNVIAPIMTDTDGGVWLQSIYYPFMQMATYGHGSVLDTPVSVPTYDSRQFKAVPFVDNVTIYNKDAKELVIFAENKHQHDVANVSVDVSGFDVDTIIESTQFYGYDVKADNRDGKMAIQPLTDAALDRDQLSATLEPLSWNMIRVAVK